MIATSGIIVHLHYCGEQIAAWALNDQVDDGCEDDSCNEEDELNHNCCTDKVVKSKISWDQVVVSQFKLSLHQKYLAAAPFSFFIFSNEVATASAPLNNFKVNAPPGNWQSIPLYLLHTSYTYYG